MEIFTVYEFLNRDGEKTDFLNCTIVVGTLGECGLGWPIVKEKFPHEPKPGEQFEYDDANETLLPRSS